MIKRLFLVYFLSIFALSSQAASPPSGEYIILVGGPSMYQWEKYKTYPHDHWWANFVRAARIRTEQLRTELGPDAKITWLVYRQGYEDRAKQEHQDLISLIGSVRDKFNINLVWFGPGSAVINYLNNGEPRDQVARERRADPLALEDSVDHRGTPHRRSCSMPTAPLSG